MASAASSLKPVIIRPTTKIIRPKMKVKMINGIAKHGFLNLPVAHPRTPMATEITPRSNVPVPNPD